MALGALHSLVRRIAGVGEKVSGPSRCRVWARKVPGVGRELRTAPHRSAQGGSQGKRISLWALWARGIAEEGQHKRQMTLLVDEVALLEGAVFSAHWDRYFLLFQLHLAWIVVSYVLWRRL